LKITNLATTLIPNNTLNLARVVDKGLNLDKARDLNSGKDRDLNLDKDKDKEVNIINLDSLLR